MQADVTTHKLIFLADDVRNVHVMSRWTEIFQFLASEDVDSNKVNLGVSVLPSL